MLLPTEAKNRFQQAADTNQQLELVARAQNDIIDDLSISIPDLDDIQKNINSTDEDLKEIDGQLTQAQEVLLELLTSNVGAKKGPGDILKTLLSNFQTTLSAICLQAATKGQTEVSILGLMDLEDQIVKIIEDLSTRGLYPETDKAAEERTLRMQQHTIKVIQFLKDLKSQKETEQAQQ
ncbi:hypothetical protein TRFO_04090 [Tritrichomonas foetus]|uniref:Uncharacterized protein n=1 Tax=Tritrichomonas foetus TaxID=1144522 RepID=A0A1J4KJK2_9EUKA|nr:hypothetical protein TRFO_04090 [Tritrichomonas foetus]|eukprot:OHT11128.1 hypothetical protein TRFO_04090 [Tritrichomonas foetus]